MLKNVLKMAGVQALSKDEQKLLKGGHHCDPEETCCYYCHCGLTGYYVFPTEGCNFGDCDLHTGCV